MSNADIGYYLVVTVLGLYGVLIVVGVLAGLFYLWGIFTK